MRKSKRNKIVLYSIIGCSLISLASVGMATWIIGIQQTQHDISLHMNVDTVENQSLLFNRAFLTNSEVIVAESELYDHAINGGIVSAKEGGLLDNNTNAMSFNFEDHYLGFSISKDMLDSLPSSITFSLKADTNTFLNVSNENSLVSEYIRSKFDSENNPLSWTYLSLNYEFDLVYEENPTLSSNQLQVVEVVDETILNTHEAFTNIDINTNLISYFSILVPQNTLKIQWGTYFDSVSPVNFYNSKVKEIEQYNSDSSNIEKHEIDLNKESNNAYLEIQDMYSKISYSEEKNNVLEAQVALNIDEV